MYILKKLNVEKHVKTEFEKRELEQKGFLCIREPEPEPKPEPEPEPKKERKPKKGADE